MHYILLIELESTGSTSCKIKGLPPAELVDLQKAVNELHISSSNLDDYIEADTQGVQILNILSKIGYMVSGQSMVIEKSNIGSRTVQIQKTVWTLNKQ